MLELTWKLFSQTGNIETYLLFKELENRTDTRPMDKNEAEYKMNNETATKSF